MDKNDAIDGAREIAAALEGPFGRKKFLPIVVEHLGYFRLARASGARWTQIAEVLARGGVLTPDGKPYPADMLRAVVSRAERTSQAASKTSPPALETSPPIGGTVQAASPPFRQRREATTLKMAVAPPTSTELGEVRDRIQRAARLRGLGDNSE